MVNNITHQQMLISPVRKLGMKVSLYNGDTFVQSFTQNDFLKSVQIERVGDNKFFGFGVSQKVNVKLVDIKRQINISTANSFTIFHEVNRNYFSLYPVFYVTEVRRDENTNELSITAYDKLYSATNSTVNKLDVYGQGYTLKEFAESSARFLGLVLELKGKPSKSGLFWNDTNSTLLWNNASTGVIWNDVGKASAKAVASSNGFSLDYPNGANFEGNETVREALDDLAEATQTIYYISENKLIFKQLEITPVDSIDKEQYFTLENKDNRRLTTIANVTELGDNTEATTGLTGTTQYVRNNAFWSLRDDIDVLLEKAIQAVGNLTVNQFECSWRGNYLLEIGDCISVSSKNMESLNTFLINDTIKFDGGLTEESYWKYETGEEVESNPSNLGEALKQTFAKVDKANKAIEIVASEVADDKEKISALELNTDSISASVRDVQKATQEGLAGVNSEIQQLTSQVEAKMDADSVDIAIKKEMANGVDKVTTATGFTFDSNGLTIDKTGSEMTTTITEDGMKVYRNSEEVLVANNNGVEAKNLHATTFLIIGENTRIEGYGDNRTGVFWIGS